MPLLPPKNASPARVAKIFTRKIFKCDCPDAFRNHYRILQAARINKLLNCLGGLLEPNSLDSSYPICVKLPGCDTLTGRESLIGGIRASLTGLKAKRLQDLSVYDSRVL
jgi:hypothetical protein